MRQPAQISLVIPFLNEKETLPGLIEKLSRFLEATPKLPAVEVIFVDDGSTDGSAEFLTNAAGRLSFNAQLLRLSRNYGTHSALRAGISKASGKWITNNYADLQDPLELLPELYEKCQEGFDLVWANRRSTQARFFERTFSSMYAWLIRKFIDQRYPEMGLDIVMFNHKVKDELDQNPEGNTSLFLQIMSLGFAQGQIFYDKRQREGGKSKWTTAKKLKLLIDTFVSFSYAPIRFVSIIGLLLFMVGIVWTIYLVLRVTLVGDLNTGWPALMSVALLGFGTTNISLGIIAEYLWRILDASRKRRTYIVDSVVDLSTERMP